MFSSSNGSKLALCSAVNFDALISTCPPVELGKIKLGSPLMLDKYFKYSNNSYSTNTLCLSFLPI